MAQLIKLTAMDGSPVEFMDEVIGSGAMKDVYFSPDKSYTDVKISLPAYADYTVALSTDDAEYGGQGLIGHIDYPAHADEKGNSTVTIYLPARTAVVLREGAPKALPPKPKAPKKRTAKTEKTSKK